MYDERLAEFSRERLDGRPIPDDLRVLLVAQWEGRTDFTRLLDLDFFEAGEVHPLLDTSYLSEIELADPEMQSVNAGAAEMAKYVQLVAKGGKGWIGYWLHPDEPADRAWHLVELDTEFTFWGLVGLTLTEGSAAEQASYQDEPDERIAFTQLAAELAELGLPLSTQDYDALDDTEYTVDPEKLMEELVEAEREKRGLR
ncbi:MULTISPECIES: hypothetical protein [unclassified Streptomyces]|jgi:hypothetical protein|uniref:hypothetical protein n=1 Tax=unclassified Streptomyces TaxID=2593676 RepID=UPI0008854C9C|nr:MULTISPECIES: hypothetical protein [unclassified Streptomyces]MDX2732334.1 hypothetical protein [Streptomyces sp. PA03-2a]MDX3770814.1 hypothetical protein [Streptomyces sp. AK08-01B]MDX3818533.1 hypothetical protein [Streptomyces sp. AK08-01A]SCZ16840.1 hypothetical protein SAMN02745898_11967 [Streptomyces sp. 136MFCol5.1]SFT31500.1 hypothetical protein SAMN04487982_12032 [Streptomyces sp. ok210]